MGIDCPDICRIVHWGTPEDTEQYVQETGRAGRDNNPSQAVLLHKVHLKICNCTAVMKLSVVVYYCLSHSFLLITFHLNNCTCCDVCKFRCNLLT